MKSLCFGFETLKISFQFWFWDSHKTENSNLHSLRTIASMCT